MGYAIARRWMKTDVCALLLEPWLKPRSLTSPGVVGCFFPLAMARRIEPPRRTNPTSYSNRSTIRLQQLDENNVLPSSPHSTFSVCDCYFLFPCLVPGYILCHALTKKKNVPSIRRQIRSLSTPCCFRLEGNVEK